MKNAYEIRGDVTAILLRRKDGTVLETLIDTTDLPKAQTIPGTIYPIWAEDPETFYAAFMIQKPKRRPVRFHRFLFDAPAGKDVDHIYHNGLDNRRSQVRVVTHSENQLNRKGAQRNNKSSGIRGVRWHRDCRKWGARVKVNGRGIHIGLFPTMEAAHSAVVAFRSRLGDPSCRAN